MDPINPDAAFFEDFFLFFDQESLPRPASFARPFNFSLEPRDLPLKRPSSFKASGFPLELFLCRPAEEFLCKYCEKVVKQPVECKKCGTLFCTSCVSEGNSFNLGSKINCSACRTETAAKVPSHLLLRILLEQKIRCKNEELGCECVFSLGDLGKHEIVCPFRQVVCQNYEFCKSKGFLKDFKETTAPGRVYSRSRGPNVKVFTCSQACLKLYTFKEMAEGKQRTEALKNYFEILNENKMI